MACVPIPLSMSAHLFSHESSCVRFLWCGQRVFRIAQLDPMWSTGLSIPRDLGRDTVVEVCFGTRRFLTLSCETCAAGAGGLSRIYGVYV